MSNDGTKRVAVVQGGGVYLSSDSGVSWTLQGGGLPTSAQWISVQMDVDGSVIVAAVDGGNLWVTTNYGLNWYQR